MQIQLLVVEAEVEVVVKYDEQLPCTDQDLQLMMVHIVN